MVELCWVTALKQFKVAKVLVWELVVSVSCHGPFLRVFAAWFLSSIARWFLSQFQGASRRPRPSASKASKECSAPKIATLPFPRSSVFRSASFFSTSWVARSNSKVGCRGFQIPRRSLWVKVTWWNKTSKSIASRHSPTSLAKSEFYMAQSLIAVRYLWLDWIFMPQHNSKEWVSLQIGPPLRGTCWPGAEYSYARKQ